MKVLLVNGSPNLKGCTYTALCEVAKTLEQEGIETEIIQLGKAPLRDCIACRKCKTMDNRCIFDDDMVNEFIQKAIDADGFVFGSPVYYAHPSGRVLSFLDRVFYAASSVFWHKPGMTVVSARRSGTTASFDAINKHFTIAQMPIVSSTYWNMVHGNTPEEVMQDEEGLQVMRNGGKNMAWLLKCIECGKESNIVCPTAERTYTTNFVR